MERHFDPEPMPYKSRGSGGRASRFSSPNRKLPTGTEATDVSLLYVNLCEAGSFCFCLSDKLLSNVGDLKQQTENSFQLARCWRPVFEQNVCQLQPDLVNSKCVFDARDNVRFKVSKRSPLLQSCN